MSRIGAIGALRRKGMGDLSAMISQQDRESGPPLDRTQARPRRLKVSELLQGEREVILEHDSQDYRLRITANGKLILTK